MHAIRFPPGAKKVRAPVKMAGVTVGRVAAIEFNNKTYEAIAVLSIDKHYKRRGIRGVDRAL